MRDGSARATTIATNNYFELSRYCAAKLIVKLKLGAAKYHNININVLVMNTFKS